MISKHLISAVSLASLLVAGIASAQVIAAPNGSVNVTTLPTTNGITAGATGTTFGTISLSGNNGGTYAISSIPITVTPGTNASMTALSNCQLVNNANGSVLTTGGNVLNALANGSNNFNFDTPLSVNSSTTTLNVRCDVASNATSGTTFQFVAGSPVITSSSIPSTGSLGVSLVAPASAAAGAQQTALALVTLDGTHSPSPVNVGSIPLMLTFSGAAQSEFTNCSLRSVSNLGTPLNTGTNAVGSLNANGGATTFTLNTPITVPAGGIQVLALACDVASVTPAASTVTVSVNPGSLAATNVSSGTSITPTTSTTANGATSPTMGSVTIAAPGSSTTPGLPNTGAGGNALVNTMLLAISALVAFFGIRSLKRSH